MSQCVQQCYVVMNCTIRLNTEYIWFLKHNRIQIPNIVQFRPYYLNSRIVQIIHNHTVAWQCVCRGRLHAVTEEESRAILASITQEELTVFRSAFSQFDKNGDGSISTKVT